MGCHVCSAGKRPGGGVLRMDLKGWGAKWPGSPESAHVVTPGVHRGPVGPAGPSPRSAPTKLFWVRPGPRAWAGTQRVEGRRLETGPLNMPGGEVRFPEPSHRAHPCRGPTSGPSSRPFRWLMCRPPPSLSTLRSANLSQSKRSPLHPQSSVSAWSGIRRPESGRGSVLHQQ